MLSKVHAVGVLVMGVMLMSTACRDSLPAPFLIEVDIRPATNAPEGISFLVNDFETTRIWEGNYTSIKTACEYLEDTPLIVECQDIDGSNCGSTEVFGVCCWAPNILDSPVIKGTLYVTFDGDGGVLVEEGMCEAADGSSTHGDGPLPDAGIPDAGAALSDAAIDASPSSDAQP